MKKYLKNLILFVVFVSLISLILVTFPQKILVINGQQKLDETFFSKANTFNAIITKETIITGDSTITYDSIGYKMSKENSSLVSEDDPQVTFITHGLKGDASHWSNIDEKFVPTENSIIDILTQMTDCNVYWAKFENWNYFKLYQLHENSYDVTNKDIIDKILDNSKHSIVLFEAYLPDQTNDFIYTQFNFLVSSILLNLQELDPHHELPKINLIGHSRGGITNLQYALDHPFIVDSIFSLGTPYLGSTTASLDNFILGGSFTGNAAGEDDITNPEIYLEYLNRWNRDYVSLYSNIKVHALGAYSSLDTLLYQVFSHVFHNLFKIHSTDFDNALKGFLKILNIGLSTKLMGLKNKNVIPPVIKQEIISMIITLISMNCPEIQQQTGILGGIVSLFNLVFDELNFNPLALSYDFMNDALVDLPSQLGYDRQGTNKYRGFKQYKKRFSIFSNYDSTKTSIEDIPVIHNLEARDKGMLLYIAQNIVLSGNLKGTPYITSIIDESSVGIVGYIGKNVEGELVIPEKIYREDGDGNKDNNLKNVVEIGENAFSDNMQGNDKITSIVIPKTVKLIKKNAFYNNEYLSSISFDQDSELQKIEKEAFAFIPNLTSFTIPTFVNELEESVFESSGITSIKGNSSYAWRDNLLISQNVSNKTNKTALYVNPKVETITIPNDVRTLSAYLFKNNQNIISINLNQTQYIGYEAFNNSTLTTISGYNNIERVNLDAFIGTKWLENQNTDMITLGKVLVYCKSQDEQILIPEGIMSIGDNCMINSNATSIILPDNLEYIGQNAFSFCPNLNWALFNSTLPPIINRNSFNENVIFYVKGISLNYYKNSIYYQTLANEIKTKEVNIDFYDQNYEYIGSGVEEYYSTFNTSVLIPQIEGYDFVCWKDVNGNEFYVNDIFNSYNDIKLTAYYEPSQYTLIMYNGTDDYEITIAYGELVDFGIPHKEGYQFVGWYDQKVDGIQITDSSGKTIWTRTEGISNLYARFIPIEYEINYETNGGLFIESAPEFFDAENSINMNQIPNIRKFGYLFDGWKCENEEFKTTFGLYKDITLKANWIGTKFLI